MARAEFPPPYQLTGAAPTASRNWFMSPFEVKRYCHMITIARFAPRIDGM